MYGILFSQAHIAHGFLVHADFIWTLWFLKSSSVDAYILQYTKHTSQHTSAVPVVFETATLCHVLQLHRRSSTTNVPTNTLVLSGHLGGSCGEPTCRKTSINLQFSRASLHPISGASWRGWFVTNYPLYHMHLYPIIPPYNIQVCMI